MCALYVDDDSVLFQVSKKKKKNSQIDNANYYYGLNLENVPSSKERRKKKCEHGIECGIYFCIVSFAITLGFRLFFFFGFSVNSFIQWQRNWKSSSIIIIL